VRTITTIESCSPGRRRWARKEDTMTTKTRLLILAPAALVIAQIVAGINHP
jgi:hypothetical protein